MWRELVRGWSWFHTFPCAIKSSSQNCASNDQQNGKYYGHNYYSHPGHVCCLFVNLSLLCIGWGRCLCSWTLHVWKEYKENLHDWMHLAYRYIQDKSSTYSFDQIWTDGNRRNREWTVGHDTNVGKQIGDWTCKMTKINLVLVCSIKLKLDVFIMFFSRII